MEVIVKFVEKKDKTGELRDMTIGKEYAAYMPADGEEDKDGLSRRWDDEVWVYRDDAGDEVVTRLCHGLEFVREV